MSDRDLTCAILRVSVTTHAYGRPLPREIVLSRAAFPSHRGGEAKDAFERVRSLPFVIDRVDRGIQLDPGEFESLVDHIQDTDVHGEGGSPAVADGAGTTLMHVVADEFDLELPAVEEHLHGAADQVEALNDAVDAIEESDAWDPRDDYGKINFVHTAYRYRLTPKAVRLYQR